MLDAPINRTIVVVVLWIAGVVGDDRISIIADVKGTIPGHVLERVDGSGGKHVLTVPDPIFILQAGQHTPATRIQPRVLIHAVIRGLASYIRAHRPTFTHTSTTRTRTTSPLNICSGFTQRGVHLVPFSASGSKSHANNHENNIKELP
jgi:hypothetical protein